MIRFLASSIFVVFLFSCSPKTLRGLEAVPTTTEVFQTHYFADETADYVYKAAISVYGNELSGILIAKKTAPETHRIVFTTEFGNKLFDFELENDDFKVNYILDDLNRPIIVNTLQADFRLLFRKDFAVASQYQNATHVVYVSKDSRRDNILFVDKDSGLLQKLVHSSRTKEKIIIEYLPETTTFAATINILHRDIKLSINLRRID